MKPTLRVRDRLQIINTAAFLVLGAAIIVRTSLLHAWSGVGFGGAMLLLGAYRTYFILRALRERRP